MMEDPLRLSNLSSSSQPTSQWPSEGRKTENFHEYSINQINWKFSFDFSWLNGLIRQMEEARAVGNGDGNLFPHFLRPQASAFVVTQGFGAWGDSPKQ